jgi:Family of unknown function (DUF6172)
MKKTFQLQVEGKHPERWLESIKHEVRKYLRRERRRPLPAGVDFWDFDCRFGESENTSEIAHVASLIERIDQVVLAGGKQFYVEIRAKHGIRKPRPKTTSDNASIMMGS